MKDLTPIAEVVSQPLLVVVNPSVPANYMPSWSRTRRRRRQPLQYTTGGIGSYGHLWWEMLRAELRLPGQHVAVQRHRARAEGRDGRTGAAADRRDRADRRAGARQAPCAASRSSRRRARSRCPTCRRWPSRASRASTPRRSTACWAPPAWIRPRAQAHATLVQALQSPAVTAQLQEQGFDVVASTPEAYATLIRSEIARWTAVVKRAGIKVE